MNKEPLFGKTLFEIQEICRELQLPSFAAKQLCEWMYKKHASQIDQMTNLSKDTRAKLLEKYDLGISSPIDVKVSKDGTKKYLYSVHDGKSIESAYIPEFDRATLCVSSQVGCKMACDFCMTGKQGFQGNLTAGEIVNQIRSLPEFEKLTNVVYMGMGEPFDNIDNVLKSLEILTSDYGYGWSPKRITVSSVGILQGLTKFIEQSKCHLAISLHTPFAEQRLEIMPAEKVNPIKEVVETIKNYDFGLQRRVSFEYIMFKGFNDTTAHIKETVKLLNGLKCRVNLIGFHPIPDSSLQGSSKETMESFRDALNDKDITTTIRSSRGLDIEAACGMLSTKKKK